MDTFFLMLKRGLMATVFVVFGFVATYIPQPYNHINEVSSGGVITDVPNLVQNTATNISTAATAISSSATSLATGSLWLKENILDGIGWALAKQIVSSMVQSIIDWINSGFQGAPSFVTDLKGFLLNAADQVIGKYIQDLGGIGSFICSPFRLDVQISVALQYAQARSNGGDGQPAPTCTLTGIINNIQGFIGGNFASGGWDDWIDITSQPEVYTPYGAALSAQAGARARLINAEGEEIKLLEFGDGFLSQKFCKSVSGFTGSQNCSIVKPGQVIAGQINKALGAGQDTLIEADEINEIIAALLGQLAKKAMTGVAGLLGLSSGTGFTDPGYQGGSYLNQLVNQANAIASTSVNNNASSSTSIQTVTSALAIQQQFNTLATTFQPQLNNYTSTNTAKVAQAQAAATFAQKVINDTNSTIPQLNNIISQYNAPNTSASQQQIILIQYTSLVLYTQSQLNTANQQWPLLLLP